MMVIPGHYMNSVAKRLQTIKKYMFKRANPLLHSELQHGDVICLLVSKAGLSISITDTKLQQKHKRTDRQTQQTGYGGDKDFKEDTRL